MAQLAKFNTKAASIFGLEQSAEGVTAETRTGPGTITANTGNTALTGTGITTSPAPGESVYKTDGTYIGTVASITSNVGGNLTAVLRANAAVSVAAVNYLVGPGPKNIVAAINLNYSDERQSDAYRFAGDELDRDEHTVITDTTAKVDFESIVPRLGTVVGTLSANDIPLADFLQACGAAIVIAGTDDTTSVTAGNHLPSSSVITAEFRRSSPDIVTQKVYAVTNARGTLDLTLEIGKKPMLKFAFQGNYKKPAQQVKLIPDYQQQKTLLAPILSVDTITLAELIEEGQAATDTTNICFNKLTAANFYGFDFARFRTGCLEGFGKEATSTDVVITVLEDSADATYDPHSKLEVNHSFVLKFGSTAGSKTEIQFSKLQLVDITPTTIGNYAALDLKFRNRGTSKLILS